MRLPLLKDAYEAFLGRRIWLGIKKRIRNDDFVFFFPDKELSCLDEIKDCIPDFLSEGYYEEAFYIVNASLADKFRGKEGQLAVLSDREVKFLLRFYCLYQFHENFLVVSLKLPEGRYAYRMVGHKGMTDADAFMSFVFHKRIAYKKRWTLSKKSL